MKQIVFECESITPMFMYGADGKTAELRPASIKGVMRFWWRAIHGNLSLEKLHEKEGEIFGSTERRSSFSIKIEHHKFNSKEIPTNYKFQIEFLLSHKCDFNIKSFFELVVLLGGFGQSAKKINQGKIRILNIKKGDEALISYSEPNSLEVILTLLNTKFYRQKHSEDKSSPPNSFIIQNNKIVSQNFNFNYPMVHEIWIENGTLNTKLKENKIFKRSLNG
jgi:CRISPR-associated protein Cmr1